MGGRWLASGALVLVACGGDHEPPSAPVRAPVLDVPPIVAAPGDAGAPLAKAPPPAPTWPRVKSITLDLFYACALYEDGRVACWGQRDARGGVVATPALVEGIPPVDRLQAGGNFACARATADKALWCWGENHAGQLGTRKAGGGFQPPTRVLDRAGKPLAVDDLIVGSSHVCALTPDGAVSCWGDSVSGQCGRMAKHDATGNWVPVLEPAVVFRGATRLLGGAYTSCALDAKDQLSCWGSQEAGYSGKGDTPTPKKITVQGRVKDMAFASGHACLLNDAGQVFCRGWNAGGQLGSAGRPQKEMDGKGPWHEDFEPELVRITELGKTYTSIAASRHETCAVSTDHDLTCLGTPDWTTSLTRNVAAGRGAPKPSPWRPHCTEREVPAPSSFRRPPAPVPTSLPTASPIPSIGGGPRFTTWSCNPRPEAGMDDVVAVAADMGRRCTVHADGRVRCVGERTDGNARTIDDAPVVVELPR